MTHFATISAVALAARESFFENMLKIYAESYTKPANAGLQGARAGCKVPQEKHGAYLQM